MGRGVGDERSERFVGAMTAPGQDYVGAAAAKADVILNVGHDITEKAPFLMSADRPQTVIHMNTFPAHGDAIYFPQLQVVGDLANSLVQLERLIENTVRADHTFALQMASKMRDSIARSSDEPGSGPVRPQFLLARVTLSSPWTTASTSSGLHVICRSMRLEHTSSTRRSVRWGPLCRPPSQRLWSIRIARFSPLPVTAVS